MPLIQDNGRVSHYVAIKEDITDKKRMSDELALHREHLEELVVERTEALARKEDELRLLLESTSEGIFGFDVDSRITFANTAAVRMLGYSDAAELVGKPSHETMHHSHEDGSAYPAQACTMRRAMLNCPPICASLWSWDQPPLGLCMYKPKQRPYPDPHKCWWV